MSHDCLRMHLLDMDYEVELWDDTHKTHTRTVSVAKLLTHRVYNIFGRTRSGKPETQVALPLPKEETSLAGDESSSSAWGGGVSVQGTYIEDNTRRQRTLAK